MARQITNAHFASEPAHTMNIVTPKDGISNIIISTNPGSYLNLDFDPAESDYSRQGADLVFTFPEGNTVTLSGFFAVDSEPLPSFILPDGTHATAEELFTGIDITPAAGPSASNQNGSGAGDYSGDAGELIGGIDRLGDADSTYWNRGTDNLEALRQALGLQDDGDGFVVSPVTPPVGPPPVGPGVTPPPSSMYSARAVLYKTDAAASDTVRFRLLDGNSDPVDSSDPSISCSVVDDNGYFDLSTLLFNPDGTVSLSLSIAGLAALAAAGNANIYEYLTVTVNGHEYRMQLVVNQSGDFDSAAENTDSNNGNSSGHEWHSETQGSTVGDRYGDQGDNEVWFEKSLGNDGAFKGSFTSYDGNDTISIENAHHNGYGMSGGATLDTGAGRDSVSVEADLYGMYVQKASEHNSITNAETVNIEGGDAAMYANGGGSTSVANGGSTSITDGGSNSITNAEDVMLLGKLYDMFACCDGTNTIMDVLGDVTLSAECSNMNAIVRGTNIITNVGGDVTLSKVTGNYSGGNMFSGSLVTNTISDVGGNVTLLTTDAGDNMLVRGSGDNAITGVQGNVTLSNRTGGNMLTNVGVEVVIKGGGSNTISDVQGDVTLLSEAGINMAAMTFSDNTISDVHGNVTLSTGGRYNMYAILPGTNIILPGTNTITNVQGDVTLSNDDEYRSGGNMFAYTSCSNTISDVHGNVTLSAGQANMVASESGINTIANVQGTVTLSSDKYSSMKAGSFGINTIRNVQRVEISIGTDSTGKRPSYALDASNGGQNIIDNSASEKALTLIIKTAKSSDFALYTDTGSANIIKGSGLNDVIDITGRISGSNSIETNAGNDLVKLNGKVEGLMLDMGDGYDTLVLTAANPAEFTSNYQIWLTALLSTGGHGIESIQVDGFASLSDIPVWLDTACENAGVDLSLHGGEVDAALAQYHTYLADHSYLINVDGSEADGQEVTLNSGHDHLEFTGNVGHTTNTVFNTDDGNDYAQARDADLGSRFTLDMGDGNDTFALSGDISITSRASIFGGDGYDTLFIGNLNSLNGTDVSGSGLGLSQLDGILNGFEALDMTGGDGTLLKIDMNGLDWLGIDSGDQLIFTGDGLFDVALLGCDNVLLVKGDSDDHVDFSGSGWSATGYTVTADSIAYTVYENSLNEYILVQQVISVTGG